VLVDTSVWVDFLNGHGSAEAQALEQLIADRCEVATCGVVVAEVFQGLRRGPDREALERSFRDLVWLSAVEPEAYFRAAELYRALRARGATIRSTIDCLVAVVAEQHGFLVLAKDRDMTAILNSGLCATRAPRLG
jgi:predicted nucleic acid-binding protein